MYPEGTFIVLVRDGSHISLEKKSTWDCRKWSFNDMLHPKTRKVDTPRFLLSFLIFLCPRTFRHAFPKASQDLLSAAFKLSVKSGVLENQFYWGKTKNTFFYFELVNARKCLPYIVESFASFIHRLHKYFD